LQKNSIQITTGIIIGIVDPFDPVFPVPVFVEFVKNNKAVIIKPFCGQQILPVCIVIPVKISGFVGS
jgi:hypothetical protein